MKPWVDTIRRETGLVEHICKCGVGHPAFGSVDWMELNGKGSMGVHGCCGCCRSMVWQLEDAQEGCRVANKIILTTMNANRKKEPK